MTGVVLWMRHGTCTDGRPGSDVAHARPDSPLTARGVQEAQAGARNVSSTRPQPAQVTSSTLLRARRTAEIIADILSTPPRPPDDVFAEWQAPECVLGRSTTEYPAEYREWQKIRLAQPDSALPRGESLAAFARRATRAMATACYLAKQADPLLIVSHRLMIGAVAALHLGHRDPATIFIHATRFTLAPAEIWTSDS